LGFQNPWDYDLTGARAVNTSQSGTVTVISTSATSTTLQLTVPGANLNTTINFNENLVNNIHGATWGLSYVALGGWLQLPGNGTTQSFTEFLFGYDTPAPSMPTSGQAMFSGLADANIFGSSNDAHILLSRASGNAALTVDFASGNITGAFTHMEYLQSSPSGLNAVPWNDVSVNASILAGTNKFSGGTSVTSTPQGALSLKGSATGYIDGAFYGPSAQNLGAIWSLSDGTISAIGGVAAGH
jgi:hypothetical protein